MADKNHTVLVVDDEPNNLRALKIDLSEMNYNVLTAKDGQEGWQVLQDNKDEISAIMLDRMMPNMDGMQFMKKLKSTPDVSDIPVIMQTAAAEKEQVIEGINAGVYYYLTKPYDKEIMLSILQAAIDDYVGYNQMVNSMKQFKSKLHLIKDSSFEIWKMDDVNYLSTFLANFFPDPEKVVYGISELIVNAIEHGNLGISYDDKTELNKQGKWLDEIDKRLKLPENKDKRVIVNYKKEKKIITLNICDEGEGFNWEEYMEISPSRATDNHGRGIAMSKIISFDTIEYKGKGNEVVCKVVVID